MITVLHDFDRSHWFGASDAKYIMNMSEGSKTWNDWWKVKCGVIDNSFNGNIYTRAGNTFEHSILKTWNPMIQFDRQILVPSLRLRVNLDGNLTDEIFEVKTFQIDKGFTVTDAYYGQAQLQMLSWHLEPLFHFIECEGSPQLKGKNLPLKKHTILAYGLYPDEYYAEYTDEQIENGDIPIERDRIQAFEIKPSRSVQRKAKRRLQKLTKQLRKDETW